MENDGGASVTICATNFVEIIEPLSKLNIDEDNHGKAITLDHIATDKSPVVLSEECPNAQALMPDKNVDGCTRWRSVLSKTDIWYGIKYVETRVSLLHQRWKGKMLVVWTAKEVFLLITWLQSILCFKMHNPVKVLSFGFIMLDPKAHHTKPIIYISLHPIVERCMITMFEKLKYFP